MWSGNQVGHNSVIKDHCFVASEAVILGERDHPTELFPGRECDHKDGITVARECVIGAGA